MLASMAEREESQTKFKSEELSFNREDFPAVPGAPIL